MGIVSIAVDLLEISETGEDARSEASEARSEADLADPAAVSKAKSNALLAEQEASEARSEVNLTDGRASEATSMALIAEGRASEATSMALVAEGEASEARSEVTLGDVATSKAKSNALLAESEAIMASDAIKDSCILSVPVSEEYKVTDIRRDSTAAWIFRYDNVSVA